MKRIRGAVGGLAVGLALAAHAAEGPANLLTPAEKEAGWKLLFDGRTVQGWRMFKMDSFPAKGWEAVDGWLHCSKNGRGGDIVSQEQFDEFELCWEWKIAAGGNSGLKYFVTDSRPSALGHEYQMYDNPQAKDQPPGKHETASFYDVLKPAVKPPVRPAGEINESRVRVKGQHVEHWLNGAKVLEYDCGSEEVKAAVAASKFKTTPGFGTRLKGRILLQDHGSEVWFRNLKVRGL